MRSQAPSRAAGRAARSLTVARARPTADPARSRSSNGPTTGHRRGADRLLARAGGTRMLAAQQSAAASRLADGGTARHRQGDARLALRPLRAVPGPRQGGLFGDPRPHSLDVARERRGARAGRCADPPRPVPSAAHASIPRRPACRTTSGRRCARTARSLHMTPSMGDWRVVIVDGADEMNRNSANAMLKILEEPPPNAVLRRGDAPGRLLPTIRSRCRKLALLPLCRRDRDRPAGRPCAELTEPDEGGARPPRGRQHRSRARLAGAGGLALYRGPRRGPGARSPSSTPACRLGREICCAREEAERRLCARDLPVRPLAGRSGALAGAGGAASRSVPGEAACMSRCWRRPALIGGLRCGKRSTVFSHGPRALISIANRYSECLADGEAAASPIGEAVTATTRRAGEPIMAGQSPITSRRRSTTSTTCPISARSTRPWRAMSWPASCASTATT